MSDKITDRCGHETGPECICDQRAGCSLFRASSHPFAETVATRWKRDPEFRAAMVEESGDAEEIGRLCDLLKRWLELDGDRDDIEKLIDETRSAVAALAAAADPENAR